MLIEPPPKKGSDEAIKSSWTRRFWEKVSNELDFVTSRVIYPEQFGTIDGVDDDVQIQAAIDSVTDDARIILSDDYVISSMILLSGDNKRLVGYGASITLADGSNPSAMLRIVRPNVNQTVEGISFDGNGANQTTGSIIATVTGTGEPEGLVIKDCNFTGAYSNSINIESGADALIDHNRFDDSGYGHIRWHAGDNSTISNNNFNASVGDYSWMALSLDGSNNTVIGNVFENIPDTAYGIRFVPDGTGPVRGNRIISNTFLGDNGGGTAISFDNNVYPTDNIISGNMFFQVVGINSAGPRTHVINNSFVDGGRPWYPAVADLDIIFSNNTVEGCTAGPRIKYSNGIISNNIFSSIGTRAILAEGTNNLIIEGNVFRDIGIDTADTYNVIDMQDEDGTESTYNTIKNNTCYSDHANKPLAFIDFDGTPTNNVIVDNIVTDVTYSLLGILPQGNTIRYNSLYPEDGMLRTIEVILTAANVKSLASSPYVIVPAQDNQTLIEFVSATLELRYSGTGAWAEPSSPDNLVFRLAGTATRQLTDEITAAGFIDQANNETRIIKAKNINNSDMLTEVNKDLQLFNTGADYTDAGGTPTSTLVVTIIYRVLNQHG